LAARADLERRVEEMRSELEVVSRGKLEDALQELAVAHATKETMQQVGSAAINLRVPPGGCVSIGSGPFQQQPLDG
jgi:hypothetical protein